MVLAWIFGKSKKKGKKRKKAPPYEEAKRIAAEGDAKARAELAGSEGVQPEILYYFATDKSTDVRVAVAENDGTPLQADVILARDVDAQVREELAYKIGRLLPGLTPDENDKLTAMAFEVLEILAQDQLPSVRAIISEELKHLENVPKTVVRRLAHDIEHIVAAPVLEYSPLLTEKELMQIIAGGIQGGALEAVARRRNLTADVADAVAGEGHAPANKALLENDTATIGAKTLDGLVTTAEDDPDMHLPLVKRSNLGLATLRRIATFVSASMLEDAIKVNKIDPDAAQDLRMTVRERIESGDLAADDGEDAKRRKKKDAAKDGKSDAGESADDDPMIRAAKMVRDGTMDEDAILDAIDDKEFEVVRHGLALLSRLKQETAFKMLDSGNGKAVAALVWKCDLPMSVAVSIQRRIAKLRPGAIIQETAEGGFPLDEDELQWFIDYFEN